MLREMDRREWAEKTTPEERTDSGIKDQAIGTWTVLILLWCPHSEILHLLVILSLASQKQGFLNLSFHNI